MEMHTLFRDMSDKWKVKDVLWPNQTSLKNQEQMHHTHTAINS